MPPVQRRSQIACGVLFLLLAVAACCLPQKFSLRHSRADGIQQKADEPEPQGTISDHTREVLAALNEGYKMPDTTVRVTEEGLEHAKELKKEANAKLNEAQDVQSDAELKTSRAKILSEQASEEMKVANAQAEQAVQFREEAMRELDKMQEMLAKADAEQKKSEAGEKLVKQKKDEAVDIDVQTSSAADQAEDMWKKAEESALQDVQKTRLCVDLPGVQLAGSMPQHFDPKHLEVKFDSPSACRDWCQKHWQCKQAVWNPDNKNNTCELYSTASSEPLMFSDSYNSSFCGAADDQDHMMDMLKKIYKAKPFLSEPQICSWGEENCMETKCCANACLPAGVPGDMNYAECDWYTCWQKDEEFAACRRGPPPEGWNGTRLGGHPVKEIPKAEEGVLMQGVTLFCFTMVVWDAPAQGEGTDGMGVVATNFRDRGLSITQCESNQFFDGSGASGDQYADAWQKVKDDGQWKDYDWTVKVDVDAVFFPGRLRWQLTKLRTPKGAPVYLKTNEYDSEFGQAMQVLSREAVSLLLKSGWQCKDKIEDVDEDYWMLSCLEGVGVDHQSDTTLMRDPELEPGADCNDNKAVVYWKYASVDDWNACHDTSQNVFDEAQKKKAEAGKHQDKKVKEDNKTKA